MTPLIDGLKKYISEKNIRFHMPGHKAKDEMKSLTNLIPEIDVTEVKGVDNLHNATSIIAKSQENAARVFKSKQTFYSVNGTTGGIYAAVNSQTSPGDKVLISRDSHKAVYQSLVLGRLECDYVYPKYDEENNMIIGIEPKDIREKLSKDRDIKVVVINYPTYYGVCSDIKQISEIVHEFRAILIVDEAHGSHLSFHSDLPESSLELGADIVIQSTHKTLPAFTQSSMVHVGTDRVDIEKLKLNMSIFQTTSPSYILLSSIDYAVDYMERFGYKSLDRIIKKIDQITCNLKKIKRVKIYNGEDIKDKPFDFDKTKFLFKIDGIIGTRLEEILREDYHIQVELSDHYYCLALITPLDDLEDLEKLKQAIADIATKNEYINQEYKEKSVDIRNMIPKILLEPHKAFYSDKTSVQLEESVGKISGEFIIPYPPGIPILVPGEEITTQIVDYIRCLKLENIEILGLSEDKACINILMSNIDN